MFYKKLLYISAKAELLLFNYFIFLINHFFSLPSKMKNQKPLKRSVRLE